MTQVFDLNGEERTLEWLAQMYDGCKVIPARIKPGDTQVWKLAAIYITEGPAVFKFEARRDGGPAVGQPVAFTYPNVENPNSSLPAVPYDNRWADRAVIDRTNDAGYYGAGLGIYYGPLYHGWILSSAPSDLLSGAGMKGSTEHRGPLHGVWVLEDVEPTHTTLRDALLYKGEKALLIQYNPTAALQKRIFADGFVPNSNEFSFAWPEGVSYVAQRAESLTTGEVRVYYCKKGNWDTVEFVTR